MGLKMQPPFAQNLREDYLVVCPLKRPMQINTRTLWENWTHVWSDIFVEKAKGDPWAMFRDSWEKATIPGAHYTPLFETS